MAKKKIKCKNSDGRYVPAEIRRILRSEVGFGCPIPGCGRPYLEWHHFDPPWEPIHIHNVDGMIALCGLHHPMADAGTFTKGQLQQYKREAKDRRGKDVQERFYWLRQKLLAVIGSNFFYGPYQILTIGNQPIIWFTTEEEGYLRLNIKMLTLSGEDRLEMEDNFWILRGEPVDFECPPSGRLIHAKYDNGDELRIEFRNMVSQEEALKRYPYRKELDGVVFPVTAVTVHCRVTGIDFDLANNHVNLAGAEFRGNLFFNPSAICINV
jgi:hypothetical protein